MTSRTVCKANAPRGTTRAHAARSRYTPKGMLLKRAAARHRARAYTALCAAGPPVSQAARKHAKRGEGAPQRGRARTAPHQRTSHQGRFWLGSASMVSFFLNRPNTRAWIPLYLLGRGRQAGRLRQVRCVVRRGGGGLHDASARAFGARVPVPTLAQKTARSRRPPRSPVHELLQLGPPDWRQVRV